MRIASFFIVFILLFFTTCEKKEKTIQEEIPKKTQQSIEKNINSIGEGLNSIAKEYTADWKEYQKLDEALSKYYVISQTEALSNAEEISKLATHLKDSIPDERLKTPAIKSRLNILQNECLRLKDMADIPAIKTEEVNTEVKKILESFSALNTKLNSTYTVQKLENELKLDPDFKKIILRTQKDTLQKKRITKINSKKKTRSKNTPFFKRKKK